MAKNTNNGSRKGPVKNRTQTYNPKTGKFVKRDETGQFVACKDEPFKSVRREKNAKEFEKTLKNKE